MNKLTGKLVLKKLNELMEYEVKEMLTYSTTATCSEPKEGFETQYDYHKRKIQIIQSAKCDILFSL